MDKFEEWFKTYRPSLDTSAIEAEFIFEAGQQSRQAELDQLNKVLDERTKEWLEAIELGTYFQDAAKPLKDEVDFLKAQLGIKRDQIKGFENEIKKAWQAVDEKDKRIEEILFVIARAKDGYYGYSKDGGDTDNLVFDLEKALGDNNANS